ncbi:MAG TPA: phosphoribosylformylglycinamidine synthase subunit PurS, partial [Thermoanaerobaculia bacterium]|nr:phosphoribosylformylglycinamidine synthase subunit PurS [Thermoanaerobaculia bacterium]
TVLVKVMLKSGVLDPQGKAIAEALHRLGYAAVSDVRAGKLFRIEVDTADAAHAREVGREMARQLLANPVIEDFEVALETAAAAAGGAP